MQIHIFVPLVILNCKDFISQFMSWAFSMCTDMYVVPVMERSFVLDDFLQKIEYLQNAWYIISPFCFFRTITMFLNEIRSCSGWKCSFHWNVFKGYMVVSYHCVCWKIVVTVPFAGKSSLIFPHMWKALLMSITFADNFCDVLILDEKVIWTP